LDVERVRRGEHAEPHGFLGAHPASVDGVAGITVRAWHPDAEGCDAVLAGDAGETAGAVPLAEEARGLFAAFLPGETLPLRYRLRFRFPGGGAWETEDAYRFLPTVGEVDLHLFHEGTHRRVYEKLGAHARAVDGVAGVAFAVWAPNARRVSVVGPWCQWDGRRYPMRRLGGAGRVGAVRPRPRAGRGVRVRAAHARGAPRRKTDPFAFQMRPAPATQSVVAAEGAYAWGDGAWMAARPGRDHAREPMAVYECHLGSWLRDAHDPGRVLGYREVAPRLAAHVKALGLHARRVPAAGRAPVLRVVGLPGHRVLRAHGALRAPDDLRFLVDTLHQAGDRRDPRLGAGALPEGRLRAAPLRRHGAVRARGPAAGRAPRLGDAHLQLRAPRGAQLPARQRALLAARVPRRRAARGRGGEHALPRLLAAARPVAAQPLRRAREPRGDRLPARGQRGGAPGVPGCFTAARRARRGRR
jgi:1,4-alpha-glucan branching enzyme